MNAPGGSLCGRRYSRLREILRRDGNLRGQTAPVPGDARVLSLRIITKHLRRSGARAGEQ
jgi:hypothetical protein